MGAPAPTQRVEVLEANAFRTDRALENMGDELRAIAQTLVDIEEADADIKARLSLVNDRLDQINQGYLEIREGLLGVKLNQDMMYRLMQSMARKMDIDTEGA